MEPLTTRACPAPERLEPLLQRRVHFTMDSKWSDREVRQVATQYALEAMTLREPVEIWTCTTQESRDAAADDNGPLEPRWGLPGLAKHATSPRSSSGGSSPCPTSHGRGGSTQGPPSSRGSSRSLAPRHS